MNRRSISAFKKSLTFRYAIELLRRCTAPMYGYTVSHLTLPNAACKVAMQE